MKLSEQVRAQLVAERGIYLTEACDRCGKLLGCVRWTRSNEPGVWCSRDCRDGIEAARRAQQTIEQRQAKRGGRPKLYKTAQARRRGHAAAQQRYREDQNAKNRCGVIETPLQPVDSAAT